MKKLIIPICILFITITLQAQTNRSSREVIQITQFFSNELNGMENTNDGIRSVAKNNKAIFLREDIAVPLNDLNNFLAFSVVWNAQDWNPLKDELWVRFKGADIEDPHWQILPIDVHANNRANRHISELTIIEKKVETIDIKIVFNENSKALVSNLFLHFYNPGKYSSKLQKKNKATNRSACICPMPDFLSREEWCPTGDCPANPNPTTTNVTHLIVHHSAGTNSSSDWAAVVRSIWDYHVNVNGWADIGYNYLVDPNGVLYEGRGDNIHGAHFCGTNSGTMGVCVMGDFTNITPTDDAKTTLKNLLAWKICDIDKDPEGSSFHQSSNMTLPNIAGHQDGCATACPGDSFYPQLTQIRMQISEQIDNECEEVSLAAPTNLTAQVLTTTSIKLDWTDNSNGESAFIIERSFMNNSLFIAIASTDENVTTYTDDNLQPNTAYFYQVKAITNNSESEYSNQVGAATVLTSIKGKREEWSAVIFPNPVDDYVFIQLPEKMNKEIQINIFEMTTSRLIKSFSAFANNNEVKKEISDLAKGIYFIQINDGIQQAFAKFIKN